MGLEEELAAALTRRQQDRDETHRLEDRHGLLRAAADERLRQAASLLSARRVPLVNVEESYTETVTERGKGLFGRSTSRRVDKSRVVDSGWLLPFPQSVLYPGVKPTLILLTDGYLGKVQPTPGGGIGFERRPDRSGDRLSALETELAWQDTALFNGPIRAGDLMLGVPDSPHSRDPVTSHEGFDAWFVPALAAVLEP